MKYKKVLRYNQLSFLPCINTVIDQDLADKSFKISILIQIENMLKRSVTLDIFSRKCDFEDQVAIRGHRGSTLAYKCQICYLPVVQYSFNDFQYACTSCQLIVKKRLRMIQYVKLCHYWFFKKMGGRGDTMDGENFLGDWNGLKWLIVFCCWFFFLFERIYYKRDIALRRDS